MQIQKITWQATLPIRHHVLWPNKTPDFCRVQGDEKAYHFGGFFDAQLISVISLYNDSAHTQNSAMQFRKFATLSAFQGQGIGSQLLQYAIRYAQHKQAEILWCDARKSAIGFYQKFGFEVVGDAFIKSGVSYVRMQKNVKKVTSFTDKNTILF